MGSGKGRARRTGSVASPQVSSSLVVRPDGREDWRIGGEADGALHREDGPAVERPDGYTASYQNGEPHRIGGPAVIGADGHTSWYVKGELHREDGPAVEYLNGSRRWY